MVVRNPVTNDTRVLREARALHDAGYATTIFGIARPGNAEPEEMIGEIRVVRLLPAGRLLRIMDAVIGTPSRWSYRWKRRAAWITRRRRRVIARLEREVRARLGRAVAGDDTVRAIPPPRLSRALDALGRLGVRLLRRPRSAIFAWTFQTTAARAMASMRPAVYHCHDLNTLAAGALAARRHRAPVIYDSHEVYLERSLARTAALTRRVLRLAEGLMIRRAAAVITVNDSIATHLSTSYGVARPAIVRNVAEAPERGRVVDVPEPFLRNGTKILYIGGITLARGIEQAIEALRYLPETTLILMGPVAHERHVEGFRAHAAALGVAERLSIVPAVPAADIDAIAAHATVGLSILPNTSLNNYFSLPNKLFSYLHAGVPVIASDFPELRAVVADHGAGLVCDPEDPKALAAAVAQITGSVDVLERFRAAAREAASIYTWEREAATLQAIYARIAPHEVART